MELRIIIEHKSSRSYSCEMEVQYIKFTNHYYIIKFARFVDTKIAKLLGRKDPRSTIVSVLHKINVIFYETNKIIK